MTPSIGPRGHIAMPMYWCTNDYITLRPINKVYIHSVCTPIRLVSRTIICRLLKNAKLSVVENSSFAAMRTLKTFDFFLASIIGYPAAKKDKKKAGNP